jgi:putative restriction endonuclease
MNGICLNALHDKAFDSHLITIDSKDYTIKISSKLKIQNAPKIIANEFIAIEEKSINLPDEFLPSREFLKIHNDLFKP